MYAIRQAVGMAYVIGLTVLLLTPDPLRLVFGSSGTAAAAGLLANGNDKIVHACCFAGMMLALRFGWPSLGIGRSFFLCSAYGAATEVIQSFIPQRSGDIWDWVADTLGAAAGALIVFALDHSWGTKPPDDMVPPVEPN